MEQLRYFDERVHPPSSNNPGLFLVSQKSQVGLHSRRAHARTTQIGQGGFKLRGHLEGRGGSGKILENLVIRMIWYVFVRWLYIYVYVYHNLLVVMIWYNLSGGIFYNNLLVDYVMCFNFPPIYMGLVHKTLQSIAIWSWGYLKSPILRIQSHQSEDDWRVQSWPS